MPFKLPNIFTSFFRKSEEEKRKREEDIKSIFEKGKKTIETLRAPEVPTRIEEKIEKLPFPKVPTVAKMAFPTLGVVEAPEVLKMATTFLFGTEEERKKRQQYETLFSKVLRREKITPEQETFVRQYAVKTGKETGIMAALGSTSPEPLKKITPDLARTILKVKPEATEVEIKTAYRTVIKEEYPRTVEEIAKRNKTTAARMVNEAKNLLLKELETKVAPEIFKKPMELPKPKPEQVMMKELGEEAPAEMERMFERKAVERVTPKVPPKELLPMEKQIEKAVKEEQMGKGLRIDFGKRLEDLGGAKGYYRNKLVQLRKEGVSYDEAKWQALEHVEGGVKAREIELAEAERAAKIERKAEVGVKTGMDLDEILKNMHPTKEGQWTLPTTIKGQKMVWDEVAADLGITSTGTIEIERKGMPNQIINTELYERLVELKGIAPVEQIPLAKVPKAKITRVPKTLYDKLPPEFYNVVKDWEGKTLAVTAKPIPEELEARRLKEEERIKKLVTRKEIKDLHTLARSVGQRLGPGRTANQMANEVARLIGEGTNMGIDSGMSQPYNRPKIEYVRGLLTDPIEEYIGRQGNAGKELSNRIIQARRRGDQYAGEAVADIRLALDALNKEEINQFADVVEKGLEPKTPALKNAIDLWKGSRDKVFAKAKQLGLDVERRRNYFPHFVPPEVMKNAVARKKAMKLAVERGWAKSIAEAESNFYRFVIRRIARRYGHLEKPREADFPVYEKDPRKVILSYLDGAYHRIADAEFFGKNDEKAYELATQIGIEGKDADTTRRMLDLILGKVSHPDILNRIERTSGAIQIVTKFSPMTTLANMIQRVEPMIWVGPRLWIQEAIKTRFGLKFTPEEEEWALRTGSILESSKRQMLEEMGSPEQISRRYLGITGFSIVEDQNRIFTDNLAKVDVQRQFRDFLKNPENKQARGMLEFYGVDILKAIANGKLSHQDLINASQKLDDVSQYPYDIESLPYFLKMNPLTRMITRWKSFAYYSAKNKTQAAIMAFKAAKQGNFKPLLNFILAMGIAYQLAGEIMNDLWGLIKRKPRDQHGFARVFANYMWIGMMYTDLINTLRYGEAGLYSWIAGPDIGTYVKFASKIPNLFKERKTMTGREEFEARTKPLFSQFFRQAPIIGPALPGLLYPPEKEKTKVGIDILKKYGIGKVKAEPTTGEDILRKYGIK